MTRTGYWLLGLTLAILIAAVALLAWPSPSKAPTTTQATTTAASLDDLIVVDAPLPNTLISSPTTVTGKASGAWYFEAVFPVELLNSSGAVIAQGQAHAQG